MRQKKEKPAASVPAAIPELTPPKKARRRLVPKATKAKPVAPVEAPAAVPVPKVKVTIVRTTKPKAVKPKPTLDEHCEKLVNQARRIVQEGADAGRDYVKEALEFLRTPGRT